MRRPTPTPLRLGFLLLLALAAATVPAAADGAQTGRDTGALAAVPDSGSIPLLGDLDLSTTTDSLPGETATHFQAMAGAPVRRVYYLRNDSLLPLADVSVHDPQAGGAIGCGPHGASGVSALPPLGRATCSATFTAVPGEHETTVTASATSSVLHEPIGSKSEAGYTAIAPGLQASLSLAGGGALPANSSVTATVTVTNTGSVEINHMTQTAAQPLSGLSCGTDGPVIETLDPGESAVCTGTLATAAGRQSVQLTVSGHWRWIRPITSQGIQTPHTVAIQAVAGVTYTGTLPPVMAPPSQQPRAAPTPHATPAQPSPAVVLPSPSPTPTPTPSPSRSAAPSPSPSNAVLAGMPQYPVSHGLPIPLKVLAIIIVPAIAVGRRTVSSIGRNS